MFHMEMCCLHFVVYFMYQTVNIHFSLSIISICAPVLPIPSQHLESQYSISHAAHLLLFWIHVLQCHSKTQSPQHKDPL